MFVEKASLESSFKMSDGLWVLTQKPQTFKERELFITGNGYTNIYPGSIIFVNSAITVGSPNPVGFLGRAPVTLFGRFLAYKDTEQKDVPADSSSINAAVNNIMRILLADKSFKAPTVDNINTKIYTSMKHLALDFKVSSDFLSAHIGLSCSTSSTDSTYFHATTLSQDYFTIELTNAWGQNPSLLFDKNITWADIKNFIGNRAIAIVTSVTYGRTFSYLKQYSAKNFTFKAKEDASGLGTELDSTQEYIENNTALDECIFNVGNTKLSSNVLKSKKTQEEINEAIAGDMDFREDSQGIVLKASIALITGESPGTPISSKYDGQYYETAYKKYPSHFTVKVKKGNGFGNVAEADLRVICDCSFFKLVDGKEQIVYSQKVLKVIEKDTVKGGLEQDYFDKLITGFTSGFTSSMSAPVGAYFKNVRFRVRYKVRAGGSYHVGPIGFIDDTSFQSGTIDVLISGSQAAAGGGVYINSMSPTKLTGRPTNEVILT